MKLKLTVREFNENDVNSECPFSPSIDDFKIYMNAFSEDLNNLESISNVSIDHTEIEITLKNKVTESHFKGQLKIILSSFSCMIVFVSLRIE